MKNVRLKKSSIHNIGAYAARDMKKGSKVIEYVGEIISKREAERRALKQLEKSDDENGAVYIFKLDRWHDIDGNVPYNDARYINHSCDPNCETEIIDGHIWIIALKNIKKGEELSYNYGYGIDDYEDHPCRCGSRNCVGYILDEDLWPKLGMARHRKH